MNVSSFRDLMHGYPKAEVINRRRHTVVRVLTTDGVTVTIDPTEGNPVVRVPIDTPIFYEPWEDDVGSMLFATSAVENPDALPPACPPELKICTEFDPVRYPDGAVATVEPVRVPA